MDLRTATDRLITGPTLVDLAREMGVAENTIHRARMDQDNPNARGAPAGWEAAVVKLARKRAGELVKLADQLEREG